jgi:hypothetical protein
MKISAGLSIVALGLAAVALRPTAHGDTVGLLNPALVDHPVSHPASGRSPSGWRTKAGAWGESFAGETLRRRGFQEVHEIKTGSNHGIDRVAVKRSPDGLIRDVKFVEVKTTWGSRPRLGETKYSGRQMSRRWMADRLHAMRRSRDPRVSGLAKEIYRYSKGSGRSLESFGEIMHVNNRTGKYTRYRTDGKSILSSGSIERLLKQVVQQRASSPTARAWAARSLATWDQIRQTQMTGWLGSRSSLQARRALLARVGTNTLALHQLSNQARRIALRRMLARAAGPIAAIVAFAVDAKELADTEIAYRNGAISLRARTIRQLTTIGGMSGALVGVWAGGVTGGWLGAFGGPFAEITVPAGIFLGATVGGIGGYLGVSAVTGYATSAWYDSIDSRIRERVEREWIATPLPKF